jgi:ABC-2 type transport system permease protein
VNVWKVVSFEIARTLRKPSFYMSMLLIPALIVVIAVVVTLATVTSEAAVAEQQQQPLTFVYTDESGKIDAQVAAALGGAEIADPAQGLGKVLSGEVDAFLLFPADLNTVRVDAVDTGLISNGKYETLARDVLELSVEKSVGDATAVRVLRSGVSVAVTAYRDGVPAAGMGAAVIPLLFAGLLFLLVCLMGSQMLAAFLEEKENRVVEMILTTIEARSLLIGKMIALVILGLIQTSVFTVPTVLGVSLWNIAQTVSGMTLSVEPLRLALGIPILAGAFCLNTISVVCIGMVMPTAKEASSMFAPVLLATVLPIYLSSMMITAPENPVVQAVTYFPWTGGLTALVRNAFGNLSLVEGLIVIAVQFGAAAGIFAVATRICRYGLLSYSKPLNVVAALKTK